MAKKIPKETVWNIIAQTKHPAIDASLIELGMIENIKLKENNVSLTMVFPFPNVPIKQMLIESVEKPLKEMGLKVKIKERTMNNKELQKFFKIEQDKWKGI